MSTNARNSPSDRQVRLHLMRTAGAIVSGVILVAALNACNENSLPTAPPPPTQGTPPQPPRTTSSFMGNIMDADTRRTCIQNAQAEIIAGPSSGKVYLQNLEYCEDPGAGFVIEDLPIGSVLSLRVSAPGYTSAQLDFVIPERSGSVDINLKRAG